MLLSVLLLAVASIEVMGASRTVARRSNSQIKTASLGVAAQGFGGDVVAVGPGEDAVVEVGAGKEGGIVERSLQGSAVFAVVGKVEVGDEAIAEAKAQAVRASLAKAGRFAVSQGGRG